MFIDDSVDVPFRKMFPDEYCKMSHLSVNDDGSIDVDCDILKAIEKVIVHLAPGFNDNFSSDEEKERFFHNCYMIGVYQHITSPTNVSHDCNVPAIIVTALYNTRSITKRVVNPENLWNFCLDFIRQKSDWILNVMEKGVCIESKILELFENELTEILEKED